MALPTDRITRCEPWFTRFRSCGRLRSGTRRAGTGWRRAAGRQRSAHRAGGARIPRRGQPRDAAARHRVESGWLGRTPPTSRQTPRPWLRRPAPRSPACSPATRGKPGDLIAWSCPRSSGASWTVLKKSLTEATPPDPKEADEFSRLGAAMAGVYGRAKYCAGGSKEDCLDVERITETMAVNREPDRLREVWEGWHAAAVPMRQDYVRFVELSNKGARALGYTDTGEMWRARYDMPAPAFTRRARPRVAAAPAALRVAARLCARTSCAASTGAIPCRKRDRFRRICSATSGSRNGRTSTSWWRRRTSRRPSR